ncbi:glycosyltransferase [Pseudomonas sp. MH10]|uniref:glycosyltransferase n=2 Tax=Pseudomonas sp. MH10 TaxID=3048627 RepID=UPI002AC91CAC|nr:glycosyltransferase [Pseudomonas sp. MH10]WPX63900.1 glycosyltransferase [Pseudomonas sp. MH10]
MHLVNNLSDEFLFLIVTRDHDLGDNDTYSDVTVNEWQDVGAAKVLYVSEGNMSNNFLRTLLSKTPHDILYLNSFFDIDYSIKPLFARLWLSKLDRRPVLLAPRGEFSPGALKLKHIKKRVYLLFVRLIRLYRNVNFQASSILESENIQRELGYVDPIVKVAIDLPDKKASPTVGSTTIILSSALKIIFLSRISPMKNLDFALKILSRLESDVVFDIYGPIEDLEYWALCQSLIEVLPSNIKVFYKGGVAPVEVGPTFAGYDLFLFPTRGENYGHVIAESLSAGTVVLVSDQTPWKNLKDDGLGWDIPLQSPDEMVEAITEFASRGREAWSAHRSIVQSNVASRLYNPANVQANRDMFNSIA